MAFLKYFTDKDLFNCLVGYLCHAVDYMKLVVGTDSYISYSDKGTRLKYLYQL